MKTYREVRQEISASPQELRCSMCKHPTDVVTLANLGGMCRACFGHYCEDIPDLPATPFDRYAMGEKAYTIARLSSYMDRHGRPLGKAQRDFLAVLQKRSIDAAGLSPAPTR